MIRYRPYQAQLENEVFAAWESGARGVMVRSPTGSGKTVLIGGVTKRLGVRTVAGAHRAELNISMSIAFARFGLRHRLIASKELTAVITREHVRRFGHHYVDPLANIAVASIDTLVNWNDPWLEGAGLFIPDEGHHVLRENKWGRCFAKMPKALAFLPTATPGRPDGKGLGSCSDGIADVLIQGPQPRDLIDDGYLVDYDVVWPEASIDRSKIRVGSGGELVEEDTRRAVHDSRRLVGDVVDTYLKFAGGRRWMTFAVDVESATEIAAAFRKRHVPAEVVSAKTHPGLRRDIMERFERGDVLQLVSVDLYGEGVDVPACEGISMARPTNSRIVHDQQGGRMARVCVGREYDDVWDDLGAEGRKAAIAASVKPRGMWIDHVDNLQVHGFPDRRTDWSLLRRAVRQKPEFNDAIPLRRCLECLKPYEKDKGPTCPYCGHTHEAAAAKPRTIEEVDGALGLVPPEVLAKLRGEKAKVDGPVRFPRDLSHEARAALTKRHHERQMAQRDLRHLMDTWSACFPDKDQATKERRFFLTFDIDVLSAMALGTPDANALRERVASHIRHMGFSL